MSATAHQLEFGLRQAAPLSPEEVAWFASWLRGRGWVGAGEVLRAIGRPPTDAAKRRLRSLANASAGRIAGGQAGYKLVEEMTADEYHRWRGWMSSQADEMKRRVVAADRVFFRRLPVHPGSGLLAPA